MTSVTRIGMRACVGNTCENINDAGVSADCKAVCVYRNIDCSRVVVGEAPAISHLPPSVVDAATVNVWTEEFRDPIRTFVSEGEGSAIW